MAVKRKATKRNKKLRETHVKSQGNKCFYCQKRFRDYPLEDTPTLEHLKPLSIGGYDKKSNTVAACYGCNQQRARDLQQAMKGRAA